MRPIIVLCANIAILAAASAETAPCPHANADSCEEWRFDRLDKELAELGCMWLESWSWASRAPMFIQSRQRYTCSTRSLRSPWHQ